jgi:hypothetical protein
VLASLLSALALANVTIANQLSMLALANVAIALDTPDRIYLLSASLQRIGITIFNPETL